MTKRRIPKQSGKIDNGLLAICSVGVLVIILVVSLVIYNQSTSQAEIIPVEIDYPFGITEDGQPFKGTAEAEIILKEFADFGCSHCGAFYQTFKELEEDYIKTGQVKLVFLNFPILGPDSINTAHAAECALAQGAEQFWFYHDVLLENQGQGAPFFSRNNLKKVAKDVGLDSGDFNNCFDTNQQHEQLKIDMEEGRTKGVTGTPALFINEVRFMGQINNAASLKDALDEALAK